MPTWRAWLQATRPPTLPAAVAPVIVGSAVAIGQRTFSFGPCMAALIGALLIQIGTNFANDLFDFQKGADTAERLGPQRVTQSGAFSTQQVLLATVVVFALAVVVGLYLVAVGGWPVVAIGVSSIAAGILYTGGPYPLGYHGLGDLFVFIFFGLVAVMGTYYVESGTVTIAALLAALPMGLLSVAILVVNNLRDIDTDRVAGKRTLAVRLGRPLTRLQYILCLAGAYVAPMGMRLSGQMNWFFFLPWLTLPLALNLIETILTQSGRPLNAALRGTGQLQLFFALCFALGLL